MRLEVERDLEAVEGALLRQDLFEQVTQTGNVPLAVAQVVNQTPLGLRRFHIETGFERHVDGDDTQVGFEHQQRHWRRAQRRFGVLAGQTGLGFAALERQLARCQLARHLPALDRVLHGPGKALRRQPILADIVLRAGTQHGPRLDPDRPPR